MKTVKRFLLAIETFLARVVPIRVCLLVLFSFQCIQFYVIEMNCIEAMRAAASAERHIYGVTQQNDWIEHWVNPRHPHTKEEMKTKKPVNLCPGCFHLQDRRFSEGVFVPEGATR